MVATFFWYDLETSGTDAIRDRILQFAGQRTDAALNPIEAPIDISVRPTQDTLLDPDAMAITGLDPRKLDAEGCSEFALTEEILSHFQRPETCVVGYNSLSFDDEFIRQTLFRNLRDPYAREWQGGNSRWDVLGLMRMAYALRPEGLIWPVKDNGRPSFTLVDLAGANGIDHLKAHDALSDIEATIGVTRLVKAHQPRLFSYFFSMRQKQNVIHQLYPLGKRPIVHVAPYYPAEQRFISLLLPLIAHPRFPNTVVCWDLLSSPDNVARSLHSVASLKETLAGVGVTRDGMRRPLQYLAINKSPLIAPYQTLGAQQASALGFDDNLIQARVTQLQRMARLRDVLAEWLSQEEDRAPVDVDASLYSGGFLSQEDLQSFAIAREAIGHRQPPSVNGEGRITRLIERCFARVMEGQVAPESALRWHQYLTESWLDSGRLEDVFRRTWAAPTAGPSALVPEIRSALLSRLDEQAALLGLSTRQWVD